MSGEPAVPQIARLFPGGKLQAPLPLPEYEQVVRDMKDYRERYNDYWLSSVDRTRTGQIIQAVISPVTPNAAVLPGKVLHTRKSEQLRRFLGRC
jgi:amidase